MRNTQQGRFSENFSRRGFLGAAAGAASMATLSGAASAQDINWHLECRYLTGGAPYRPAFATMFEDPMFVAIQVGPADIGPTGTVTIPTRAGGRGRGRGPGAGRGAPAPPVFQQPPVMPPDTPIIPSGAGQGIGSLTHTSVSVVLLNDQTDWADTSRESIQTAFDANQELLGVVVFHNAVADNQTWPLWYQDLAGGLLVLNDHDGMKRSTVTRGASYDVHAVGNHPIVQDIPPFRLTGEDAYKGMLQSPKITPLLEATGPATDRVVAWVGPNPDKARIVVISPGTSAETFRNPAFRRLVRNSVLWAGHRLD